MLDVTFTRDINSFDYARKFFAALSSGGISNGKERVEIYKDSMKISGSSDGDFLNFMNPRQIFSIKKTSNLDEEKNSTAMRPEKRIVKGLFPASITKTELLATSKFQPGDVVKFDFGEQVGCEFGGKHPAIVIGDAGNGQIWVVPATTKYWPGKDVLIASFASQGVMKQVDNQNFINYVKLNNIRSFFLVCEPKLIDPNKRFIERYGKLSDEWLEKVKAGQEAIPKCLPFTMEDLHLSGKAKMLVAGKEEQLMEIGNSELPYKEKVRKLLNVFGIYPDLDDGGQYVYKAIISSKFERKLDMDEISIRIARNTIDSPKKAMEKLCNTLRKRFKSLFPCVDIFIRLINQMAYFHEEVL